MLYQINSQPLLPPCIRLIHNIVGEDDPDDLAKENLGIEPEPKTERQIERERIRHEVNQLLERTRGRREQQ